MREEVEELISESYELEDRPKLWQSDDFDVKVEEIRRLESDYLRWYGRATSKSGPGYLEEISKAYNGGTFSPSIKSFLSDPLKINPLIDPRSQSFISKWQSPYEMYFKNLVAQQRQVLQRMLGSIDPSDSRDVVLGNLESTFRRFSNFWHYLKRSSVVDSSLEISSEKELQEIVGPILRIMYDDVRPEDYVPSRSGANSRVDFLLPDVNVAVETKMTRVGLSDVKLGEELLIDAGRYRGNEQISSIFAFIYDPDRRVLNSKGLESDLNRDHSGLLMRAVVLQGR